MIVKPASEEYIAYRNAMINDEPEEIIYNLYKNWQVTVKEELESLKNRLSKQQENFNSDLFSRKDKISLKVELRDIYQSANNICLSCREIRKTIRDKEIENTIIIEKRHEDETGRRSNNYFD